MQIRRAVEKHFSTQLGCLSEPNGGECGF